MTAAKPDPIYLTTEEVAARFRTSPSSVREWRHTETGPLGTRFGKRVLYLLDDVEAWERDLYRAEHGADRTTATQLTAVSELPRGAARTRTTTRN